MGLRILMEFLGFSGFLGLLYVLAILRGGGLMVFIALMACVPLVC